MVTKVTYGVKFVFFTDFFGFSFNFSGVFVGFLIIETGQQSDKKNHKKYHRL